MKIVINEAAGVLTASLEGRLDTKTSPMLEKTLGERLDGVKELVLDMTGLDYLSSAGLRVLLKAQKKMSAQGSMRLVGVNEIVMEVFEITGFTDVLCIE